MGTGYPPEKGGPLRHADAVGIAEVVQRLKAMEQQFGVHFKPAPILERMAAKQLSFHQSDLTGVISAPVVI